MLESRIETGINLLFWALTGWLIAGSFSIQSMEIELINGVETVRIVRSSALLWQLLACIGISAAIFYVNLWLLGQMQYARRKLQIAACSALLLLLAIAVFWLLERVKIFGSPAPPLPVSLRAGIFSFYYAISVAYGIGKIWLRGERQRQQLLLEKKQTELSLLRQQLHPHFLFNALNNLLAMVDQEHHPKFAASLDKLSGLLRYVVYDVGEKKVPVHKEISFIRNFAELQLLRFEAGEVNFQLEVLGVYDQQLIEPGIFIPFIENAFKYGAEPETESDIRVVFDLENPGRICFSVRNPIHPVLQRQPGSGAGIPASRQRLELAYPGRHSLSISDQTYFEVKIELHTYESDHR